MRQETVLLEAKFNSRVVDYWLLSGTLVLCCTIIGIPFAIVWYLVGRSFCRRYLARIACILTDRSLIIRKGMFNRVEKTIPLDKITDLAMLEGPIMRAMGLKGFRVETAGGAAASTGGYLVQLTGIVDTEGFRDAVLTQRDAREDRLAGRTATAIGAGAESSEPAPVSNDMAALIREIRNDAPRPNGLAESDEAVRLLREIRDTLIEMKDEGR